MNREDVKVTVFSSAVFEGLFGSVKDRYYIKKHRERWEKKYGRAYPKGQLARWDGVAIHIHKEELADGPNSI